MEKVAFTTLQRLMLVRVALTEADGDWYRARSSGERVTLASLHTRGLLLRRAWRGTEGDRSAAHEYRLHELLRRELLPLARERLQRQRDSQLRTP